jgi:hypothetical protein
VNFPSLADALVDLASRGGAYVPGALSSGSCLELVAEVQPLTFVPVPRQVGTVHQQAEELAVRVGDVRLPAMAALAAALVREVASSETIAEIGGWSPDEATYQWYRGRAAGITPHRDFKGHRLLIAVFTLLGRAPFRIVVDRAGVGVLASWVVATGDLCLLRGPGFAGNPDGRPIHSIGPPHGPERLSLAFRMSERQGVPRP